MPNKKARVKPDEDFLSLCLRFMIFTKCNIRTCGFAGMEMFLKETSFHGIQLDTLFVSPDSARKQELATLVTEGIHSGAIVPLCTSVFPEDQVEQAFRYFHTV